MIRVLFFARFRELLGTDAENLELSEELGDVASLMKNLASRGGRWEEIFDGEGRVMVAINQEMTSVDATINDGDEVAFFPPVTGG